MAYLEDSTASFDNLFIKRLFASCFFSGSFFIIYFSTTDSIYLTLIVPIAIMVFYILMGFRKTDINKVSDQFADSIYYLGFLYTLVALAVSLYAIHENNYELGGNLISRFGLALLTTILGLFGRIYIVNFRQNVDDLKKISEGKLTTNVERFASEIDFCVDKLKVFNKTLIQDMESLVSTTTKNIERTTSKLETFTEGLKDSLDSFTSDIDDANKKYIESFNGTIEYTTTQIENVSVKSFEELSKSFSKFEGDLIEVVQLFVNKLDGIVLPPDLFTAKLDQPLNQLIFSIQNTVKEIEETDVPLNIFTEKFEQPLDNFKAYLNTFIETIDEYIHEHGRIDHETKNLSTGLNYLNEHVTDLTGLITEINENMQLFKNVSIDTNQFANSFQNATEQVSNFSKEAQKHIDSTGAIDEQFRKNLELANEHRNDMGDELAGARENLKTMYSELLNAAVFINNKFKTEL